MSILLAFGIQAWWERRQREQERRDFLAAMFESVQPTEGSVTRNIRDSEQNRELAARFYASPDEAPAHVQRHTARALLNSLPVARMEAYNTFVEGITQNDHSLASDQVVTPLLVRGNAGAMPEEFSEQEDFRIRLNYTGLLRLWEGLFRSPDTGILPPSTLQIVG